MFRVEYRWVRDGLERNAGGWAAPDRDAASTAGEAWVLNGIRAGVGSAHRGPMPETPALGRRMALVTETRVVEQIGPEVVDLSNAAPEVVEAITGERAGPRRAPVAGEADDVHP